MDSSGNHMNIINYNIRSFRQNADSFFPIFDDKLPQIFVLSETWFTENYKADIPNFNSHHTIRPIRQSGGISVFVSNIFSSSTVCQFSYCNNEIEICTVEIRMPDETIYLISIYRPHSGTITGFISEMERILGCSIFRNNRCFVVGDLNINLCDENSSVKNFVECLQTFHFFPVINKPTRFCPSNTSSPSILDQIWSNSLCMYKSGILTYDVTDHCPTFIQFPICTSTPNDREKVKISFRLFNDDSRASFSNAINQFN